MGETRHGLVCGSRNNSEDRNDSRNGRHNRNGAILVCVLLLSTTLAGLTLAGKVRTDEGPALTRTETYAPLSPFRINGNAEFVSAAIVNGWPGSGTAIDPYIIQGYEVFAVRENAATYIGNTTVHFILSSCWLHGGEFGLSLSSVTNASISQSVLSGYSAGANLVNSRGIALANNSCAQCPAAGLLCFTCESLDISDNAFGQSETGVMTFFSNACTIVNNTFANCSVEAVALSDSTAMTLRDNIMNGCGIRLEGSRVLTWSSHAIDGSNLVNGKPVVYLAGQIGGSVTSGAGQVIIGNCTSLRVEGLQIDNTTAGVAIGYSSHLTVVNCSFHYDDAAISFTQSDNFTVSDNSVIDCTNGISEFFSNNFTIENNSCLRGDYGLYIYSSQWFHVDNNSISESELAGINIAYSTYGDFTNNSQVNTGFMLDGPALQYWATHSIHWMNTVNGKPVYASRPSMSFLDETAAGQVIYFGGGLVTVSMANIRNTTAGIIVAFNNWYKINANNCSDNHVGLLLYNCGSGIVETSSFWNNDYGIVVEQSVGSKFQYDVLGYNSVAGIYASQSRNLDIGLNDLYGCGIVLDGTALENYNSHSISPDAWVNRKPVYYLKNQVGGAVPENAGQVILANCRNVVVANEAIDRASVAIEIAYSTDIVVSNCSMTNNVVGLDGLGCSRNLIVGCLFSSNYYGIEISESTFNEFRDNFVSRSTSYGLYLGLDTRSNRVWNNTFEHNNGSGDVYNSTRIQARDECDANRWNASAGGNYWADWTVPDLNDDGIVDVPYLIDGGPGSTDFLPLADPTQVIPEFSTPVLTIATIASALMIAGTGRAMMRRRE